jgi:hypothetical protein
LVEPSALPGVISLGGTECLQTEAKRSIAHFNERTNKVSWRSSTFPSPPLEAALQTANSNTSSYAVKTRCINISQRYVSTERNTGIFLMWYDRCQRTTESRELAATDRIDYAAVCPNAEATRAPGAVLVASSMCPDLVYGKQALTFAGDSRASPCIERGAPVRESKYMAFRVDSELLRQRRRACRTWPGVDHATALPATPK